MSIGTRIQADLHQRVVLLKVCCIQLVGLDIIVDQALPRHRDTEDIEAIDVGEVLHLSRSHLG